MKKSVCDFPEPLPGIMCEFPAGMFDNKKHKSVCKLLRALAYILRVNHGKKSDAQT